MRQSFAQKIQTPKAFKFLLNQVKIWTPQVSVPPTEHCQDQPAASSELGENGDDPAEPSLEGQLLFLLWKKLWKIHISSLCLSTLMSLQAEQKNRVISVSSQSCHRKSLWSPVCSKRWHQPAAFQLHSDFCCNCRSTHYNCEITNKMNKWVRSCPKLHIFLQAVEFFFFFLWCKTQTVSAARTGELKKVINHEQDETLAYKTKNHSHFLWGQELAIFPLQFWLVQHWKKISFHILLLVLGTKD